MTLEQQIIAHAEAEYPNESCGLIAEGIYYPCRNIASENGLNSKETFVIAPADWRPAEIVVHSHPQKERYLSDADRLAQHQSHLDWWLCSFNAQWTWDLHKFAYTPLLRGRKFEYGVNDCCTMITDSYRLCGITLKAYERKNEQDDINSLKIINSLADAGFSRVSFGGLQAGDVIVTSIRGEANHASVYLGDETVLHHPYGGLSRVEGMGGYWHKNYHSCWRHNWQPDMITAIHNDLAVKLTNQL